MAEQTFIMIKPDGVQRGLVIISSAASFSPFFSSIEESDRDRYRREFVDPGGLMSVFGYMF
jgi:hypothetical protein